MKYKDISPLMRAFIGTREVFRKLGFSADDLYCETARSARFEGALSAFCSLHLPDGKTFSVELGSLGKRTVVELEDEYMAVCHAINSRHVSAHDLQRILEECEAFQIGLQLVMALQRKGIVLPVTERRKK